MLGAAALVAYAATATYSQPIFNDPLGAMVPAWHLGQHRSLDLAGWANSPWVHATPFGTFSDRMPGVILWGTPFYAALGTDSAPTFVPAALAGATAAALAVALCYLLLLEWLPRYQALVGSVLFGFATATWTVSAESLYAHGPDQAWLLAAMLSARRRRWWWCGAFLGLAVLTRPHLATVAALIGLGRSLSTRDWRPAVRVGLGPLAGMAALVVWNGLTFHQWTPLASTYADGISRLGEGFAQPLWQAPAGLLVSPERGVLVLSAFLLVLLPGLRRAWALAPGWAREAALGGLLYLTLNTLSYGFSSGAGFYGYRYPIETLTLAIPLFALAWREWTSRLRWRRRAFAVLAFASFVQCAAGAILFTAIPEATREHWTHWRFVDALTQPSAAWEWALFAVAVLGAAMLCSRIAAGPASPGDREPPDAPSTVGYDECESAQRRGGLVRD